MAKRLIGIVAIGRNEGERLKACLRSLPPELPAVYVDSASTDGSADFARAMGAEVVDLDLTRPFTAARARNAGFERLLRTAPEVELVQFIDGDCELEGGWIDVAAERLRRVPALAAVCGRRREKFPERSFYNALCDREWDTPVGLTNACGGDALFKVPPLRQAGGFDPALTAHEEPDLCSRLRTAGFLIERLDLPMTRHDADITSFRQFWRRNTRAGYGYAQVAAKHRGARDNPARDLLRRTVRWGFILPALCLLASVAFAPWGLLSWGIFPLQIARRAILGRLGWQRASVELLQKFAELKGVMVWLSDRVRNRQRDAVQYKSAG